MDFASKLLASKPRTRNWVDKKPRSGQSLRTPWDINNDQARKRLISVSEAKILRFWRNYPHLSIRRLPCQSSVLLKCVSNPMSDLVNSSSCSRRQKTGDRKAPKLEPQKRGGDINYVTRIAVSTKTTTGIICHFVRTTRKREFKSRQGLGIFTSFSLIVPMTNDDRI